MMLRGLISSMLVVGIAVTSGFADDLVAPPWRGQPNTTYQAWEFGTSENPVAPDLSMNPNGTASADILGMIPGTYWKSEDRGHFGVWRIGEAIQLEIPNFPPPNPWKEIWIQITYDGGESVLPEILVLPEASSITLIETIDLGDSYSHETYSIILEPNPPMEIIYVMPRFCEIYIDEIVVETICVPEPATLSLLAIGASVLVRCRRR